MNTVPELKTERLTLRPLVDSDREAIRFLRSNEEINQYIKRQRTNTDEDVTNFITRINNQTKKGEILFWCITKKDTTLTIGTICLWKFSKDFKTAEIGYDLHPKSHGQGIMSEALYCVLDYGFETLHLDTIEAYTHKDNIPSKKLLKNNNFRYHKDKKDEGNLNNSIFSIHKDNFKK